MVELSEDESGILPKIEYWRDRDSILGSCGYRSDTHKCDDHFHPIIGHSWERLVAIMEKAVASSYVRVIIMVNPPSLVNWLPPTTVLVNATCNKFDHLPHVVEQWDETLRAFDAELKPLGCVFSGRGSDGDARRYKLQHATYMRAIAWWMNLRRVTIVLQRRWCRPRTVAYVVLQIVPQHRHRLRHIAPVVRRPIPEPHTFTLPVSLPGAIGYTFAVRVT